VVPLIADAEVTTCEVNTDGSVIAAVQMPQSAQSAYETAQTNAFFAADTGQEEANAVADEVTGLCSTGPSCTGPRHSTQNAAQSWSMLCANGKSYVKPVAARGGRSCTGSNDRVTIQLCGKGLTLTCWHTYVWQYPWDGCRAPDAYDEITGATDSSFWIWEFYANNHHCYTVPPGDSQQWYYRAPNMPYTFSNSNDPYHACNAWEPNPPFSGFPCAWIHK
jgi:hypothetical protein